MKENIPNILHYRLRILKYLDTKKTQEAAHKISIVNKNLNAPRPSEHPPVRGKHVKTFRWDHRLQLQNLFMAFKRVPRW